MTGLRAGEIVTYAGGVYAVVEVRGDRAVLRSGDEVVRIARVDQVQRVARPGSIMGGVA